MLVSGIYRILCVRNGRFYYGSAKNFDRRWIEHKKHLKKGTHKNPVVQNCWNKHGEAAFRFEIVEFVEPIEELLLKTEDKYIDQYFGTPNCMNLRYAARPQMSDSTRLKISKIMMGNTHWAGKHHSKETRLKMSKSLTGIPSWNKGKHLSEEHRRKLSESQKGRKRKKHSNETRLKMSQAQKICWEKRRGVDKRD